MQRLGAIFAAAVLLFVLGVGCSAVSKEHRLEAEPRIPFKETAAHPDRHRGDMVILGGYILEVRNEQEATFFVVLETPLDFNDEPGEKDRSEGRFVVEHEGFLDPEIYSKDRKITVAGTVKGTESVHVGEKSLTVPLVESRQLILWPVREPRDYYGYPDYYFPYYWGYYGWPYPYGYW